MSEKKIGIKINSIDLLPTTAGDQLVRYSINELGNNYDLTVGVHGKVFDFSDGSIIVYSEDMGIVSLFEDGRMSIYQDGDVEDISATLANKNKEFLNKLIMMSLRGALDEA